MSWAAALAVLLAGLAGGAIGSFAGVVAHRGWREAMHGRSHCDSCGRVLTPLELVPVLSFAALRGRCFGCAAAIGWDALAWESAGALLGGAACAAALLLSGH